MVEVEVNPQLFRGIWRSFWTVLFASSAVGLQYWIPPWFASEINMSSLLVNWVGSFVIAVITVCQQVQFQFLQTYLIFEGAKAGGLSVLTTFGHLISDTDRLTHFGQWWISPVNLLANVVGAFVWYQFGRVLAVSWVSGKKFSTSLMQLDLEEHRMAHEMEKEVMQAEFVRADLVEDPAPDSPALPAAAAAATTATSDDDGVETDHLLDAGPSPSLARVPVGHKVHALDSEMQRAQDKHQVHLSPWPQRHHMVLMAVLLLAPLVSVSLAGSNRRDQIVFIISLLWSVLGSALGSELGQYRHRLPREVQWGTFRINVLSCILIATAHNILIFRHYFPYSDTMVFRQILMRFITDFCGSLSSFAGLIDETACLFNASIPKKIAARNLLYNFFFGLSVFFLMVYLVGAVLFYR